MGTADEIRDALREAFAPDDIEVRDDSAAHAGHAGARPGGESHFSVRIRAPAFAGMTRLARHRAVHAALGPELIARIHALALEVEA